MGIQGMVTRTGWNGEVWGANQRITVDEALARQHAEWRLRDARGVNQRIDYARQACRLRHAGRGSAYGGSREDQRHQDRAHGGGRSNPILRLRNVRQMSAQMKTTPQRNSQPPIRTISRRETLGGLLACAGAAHRSHQPGRRHQGAVRRYRAAIRTWHGIERGTARSRRGLPRRAMRASTRIVIPADFFSNGLPSKHR